MQPVLGKIERNFRAAVRAQRARGVAAVHGNLQKTGRTEYARSVLRALPKPNVRTNFRTSLPFTESLMAPEASCRRRNIFRREIRHQVAERIHAQYNALDGLARGLRFRHRESHEIRDFFAERFRLKGFREPRGGRRENVPAMKRGADWIQEIMFRGDVPHGAGFALINQGEDAVVRRDEIMLFAAYQKRAALRCRRRGPQ